MLIIAVTAAIFAVATGGRFVAAARRKAGERTEKNRRIAARQDFWIARERAHAQAGRNIAGLQRTLARSRNELDRYFTEQGW